LAEIAEKKDLFGQKGESVTFGFLGYPVSQAADITFCRASIVPVGEDQLPMIEQAREIIDKFHRLYSCNIFPRPEAKLSKAPRIIGLDGNTKMSKSLNNAIYLKDTAEETSEKIKTAKTDSEPHVAYDPIKRPEISNLILIYSLMNNLDPIEAAKELKGINYSSFKVKLADDLNKYLSPIREHRKEIKLKDIKEILTEGHKKALLRGEETIKLVREAMKINY